MYIVPPMTFLGAEIELKTFWRSASGKIDWLTPVLISGEKNDRIACSLYMNK